MPANDHLKSGAVSGADQYKSVSMTLCDKTEEGGVLKKEDNVIEVKFPYMGYKADESNMENKADYFTEDQEQTSPVLLERYILFSTY